MRFSFLKVIRYCKKIWGDRRTPESRTEHSFRLLLFWFLPAWCGISYFAEFQRNFSTDASSCSRSGASWLRSSGTQLVSARVFLLFRAGSKTSTARILRCRADSIFSAFEGKYFQAGRILAFVPPRELVLWEEQLRTVAANSTILLRRVAVSSGPNSKDQILLFVPCERAEQAAGQFVSKTNEQSGEPNQRKGSTPRSRSRCGKNFRLTPV